MPEPIDVVLSTDVGCEIDDQWTITHLLTHPRFNVKGLMSVHAPVFRPPAGRTCLRVLEDVVTRRLAIPQPPPMLEGASKPMPGADAWVETPAAKFLVDLARNYSAERRLTVLAIGAVTDIGAALRMDPGIADRITITQMGFWSWEKGATDYNILNDPAAQSVILASDAPLTAGCIEVCKRDLAMHIDQAERLLAPLGAVGEWLWVEFQDFYYRRILPTRTSDFSKPWVIWDTVVLAHHLGMATHSVRQRPSLAADGALQFADDGRTMGWIESVDAAAVWADFSACVKRRAGI